MSFTDTGEPSIDLVAPGVTGTPGGTLRAVFGLAMPVLAEQFSSMLVGFSDTVLTGHYLTRDHLAAMNLMAYALWMLSSLFIVITLGAAALVARFIGAREPQEASHVLNQALAMGAMASLPLAAIGFLSAEAFPRLLELEATSADLAASYFRILCLGIPALMIQSIGIACLRAAGDTVSGLLAMIAVNVANIVFSWGLMLGWGPLPKMGWNGAATGTAIGFLVGGSFIFALLLRGRAGLKIHFPRMRPDWHMIRRMLRIGVPGGADIGTILFCQFWYLSIVNGLGPLAAAAHGVAIRVEALAYLPGIAFQVAAATLAGQHLGARDQHQARHAVLTAALAGMAAMSAAGVVFFTAARPLVLLLVGGGHPEVLVTAVPLLRIIAFGMPMLAATLILAGALRGAGDTRWPLVFTVIGFALVRIPLAYLLTGWWHFGIQGAWYAMLADLTVRCFLVTGRFIHGGWRRIEV